MKTEFLKELGLTEEQIKSIMAENGKDVEVEKEKIKTATTELEGAKTQLSEANKTITDLKKNNGDNETLQTKVKEYEKAIADQKTENIKIQREAAIKVALKGAGCSDEDYFMFKHKDKIEFDENNTPKNLDSIISTERESKSIIFNNTVVGTPPIDGKSDPTPQAPTDLKSALAQRYENK
jgi:DNA-binding transcriptional MerR regulator